MGRISAAGRINLVLKITIALLVFYGAAHRGLPQYVDKGMGCRLFVTPAALANVPVWWWLNGRPRSCPNSPDKLLVAPFFVDILGLAFGLYGTTAWFDPFAHFTGRFGMTGAFGVFFSGFGISRRNTLLHHRGLIPAEMIPQRPEVVAARRKMR